MNRRDALRWATILLGGIVSPGAIRALAAEAKPNVLSGSFFNPTQNKQVSLLAELIIPTTDCPGAIAAGVPEFISMMVGEWYTDTERKIFLQGLIDMDQYCQQAFQQRLHDCDQTQLTQALSYFESLARDYVSSQEPSLTIASTDEYTPFFSKIKELTILGYFTSEVGVTQALAYNPMPMEYKSDIALAEVDNKQWAQY